MRPQRLFSTLAVAAAAALAVACTATAPSSDEGAATVAAPTFECAPDNGGIVLPDGFCAVVFADEVGSARHIAVSAAGDVYVQRRPSRRRNEAGEFVVANEGGVLALRDSSGRGPADTMVEWSSPAGTGLAIHDGYLYYASTTEVFRVALDPQSLVPTAEPELIVGGFLQQGQHASKPMTFDGAGNMYVTVGAPSNACQETMRTPGSPGLDPCPQLDQQAGIWRFSASQVGQVATDGHRFASGIRNALGLDWSHAAGALFALQHGRDSLFDLYGDLYTLEQSAELPAEEMFRVGDGDDFGWPYCYYDSQQSAKVLAPEYGGDGMEVGRCADVGGPIAAFPAHWAPNDLLFYTDGSFPADYEGGAFIAFHGSWNRMPFPQQGYNVVFVPFANGAPSGEFRVFAHGFPGVEEFMQPREAAHRPTGLAQGPDGSLYITSDSGEGRIWRVRATSETE